jgi:hypothetical protein
MKRHLGIVAATALVIVAGGLAGCDGNQQRPLNYEKGTYLGRSDEALGEQKRHQLRERAAYQGFGSNVDWTGSTTVGLSGGSAVRPPEPRDGR